jgi:hypothetical protein
MAELAPWALRGVGICEIYLAQSFRDYIRAPEMGSGGPRTSTKSVGVALLNDFSFSADITMQILT